MERAVMHRRGSGSPGAPQNCNRGAVINCPNMCMQKCKAFWAARGPCRGIFHGTAKLLAIDLRHGCDQNFTLPVLLDSWSRPEMHLVNDLVLKLVPLFLFPFHKHKFFVFPITLKLLHKGQRDTAHDPVTSSGRRSKYPIHTEKP